MIGSHTFEGLKCPPIMEILEPCGTLLAKQLHFRKREKYLLWGGGGGYCFLSSSVFRSEGGY